MQELAELRDYVRFVVTLLAVLDPRIRLTGEAAK